ncbi:unnamed protein product, partial [Phaeothamnion confervicola]
SNGKHAFIGRCCLSVADMVSASTERRASTFTDDAARARKGAAYKGGGQLFVDSCVVLPRPSFFEFLSSGCELEFVVAVDMTASNGNPQSLDSLHYVGPDGGEQNEYALAIESVGRVLEYYSATRMYSAFGFGGVPPGHTVPSHCFPLNGNEAAPEVAGIRGVLDVYRHAIHTVRLSGPTLFAPTIQQASAVAASMMTTDPRRQKYFVLLLLTDGLLGDMDNTVDAIVAAAELPLSIIIVGVGHENFSAMQALDGDSTRLRSWRGATASRDIVQFVPLRDLAGRGAHALAKEVLAELPVQLLAYMAAKGIMPV